MAAQRESGAPSYARIAHLSDLHCDASDAWVKSFRNVRDLLIEKRPDAVLITGDCADHPKRRHYRALRLQLTELKQELQSVGREVPVVAIPGNHDYSFFGNRIFGRLKPNALRDELSDFLADQTLPADLVRLAADHRIVVFPFDSNQISRMGFARGYVESPRERFKYLKEKYITHLKDRKVRWDDCLLVAIMHHHPFRCRTHGVAKNSNRFIYWKMQASS